MVMFVVVMVMFEAVMVMFVAVVIVAVCGHHGIDPCDPIWQVTS